MEPLPLTSVKEHLADLAHRTSTITVDAASLRLDGDARLTTEGQSLRLTDQARAELARRASIPAEFLKRCPADLQATIFNTFYPQAVKSQTRWPRTTKLILRDRGIVIGLTNPDLTYLSGAEVLHTALNARPKEVEEDRLEVVDFHLDGSFRLSLVSPQLVCEPRVGDVLRAGVTIIHSDAGAFGTRIDSYLLALACENGMVSRICRHSSSARARVRRAGGANKQLTLARVGEMARRAWQELRVKMEAVEQLAKEPVDNPGGLIRAIGEKLRISDRLIDEMVNALDKDEVGRSDTLWAVVGAIARIGTHSERLSANTSRFLRELSGDLIDERVERCPTCGAVSRGSVRYFPRR